MGTYGHYKKLCGFLLQKVVIRLFVVIPIAARYYYLLRGQTNSK